MSHSPCAGVKVAWRPCDLYDLVRPDARRRQSDDEITVFKNSGGAHLDLMIASWIIDTLSRR